MAPAVDPRQGILNTDGSGSIVLVVGWTKEKTYDVDETYEIGFREFGHHGFVSCSSTFISWARKSPPKGGGTFPNLTAQNELHYTNPIRLLVLMAHEWLIHGGDMW